MNVKNSIDYEVRAKEVSIRDLLLGNKFYIDFFQREYRWNKKQMEELINDLLSAFDNFYSEGDSRPKVNTYGNYYLGPMVFSHKEDKRSIIDGQQRITSLTLILIYLNNLQKDREEKSSIEELIFSDDFGEKSFNISDAPREKCLKALFENDDYTLEDGDSDTIRNMLSRYKDIEDCLTDEVKGEILPHFIDWLTRKVIIVEVKAYSDDNAYTVFETMNDRGLNLTPTDMLKGYILSKITDEKKKSEVNEIWKSKIQELHSSDNEEHKAQAFFKAWFRAKYAKDMRPSTSSGEDKDFELIGNQFHRWFKKKHEMLFGIKSSDEFYDFFKKEFPFWVDWYLRCESYKKQYDASMPHMCYIGYMGIAESIESPLLLAAVNITDSENDIYKKLDMVARYIETFTVRRSINAMKYGQTTIRNEVFKLILGIRGKSLIELGNVLASAVSDIDQGWDKVTDFRMNQQNKKFVKHLLSRISSYVDNLSGTNTNYMSYRNPQEGRQFEIEHIWSNEYDYFTDQVDGEFDFDEWRNKIGALVLLPNGTNQSFSNDPYEEKLEHYIKEKNTYVQSLCSLYYDRNPNFTKQAKIKELSFTPHPKFEKGDITERSELVQRICEQLWSIDYFKN